MKSPVRILLMSAPIGAGHVKAAEAVGEMILKLEPKACVRQLNIFDTMPRALGNLFLQSYYMSLKFIPGIYRNAYAWGNESSAALRMRTAASVFFAHRIKPIIDAFAPDAIICTHATPAGAVGLLAQSGKLRAKRASIITDFVVHRLWIHQATDVYFVAHDRLKDRLIAQSVSPERVMAFGIPLAEAFRIPYKKKDAIKKLNIPPNVKTVLIMGGGAGLLPMEEIAGALDRFEFPLHMMLITGYNEKLYRRLTGLKLNPGHTARVVRFVENVHELMAAADVLISKAGGVSASEALCIQVPLLIYQPIPGQEKENAAFLEREGAALSIAHIGALCDGINEIFRIDDNVAEMMKISAKHLARPDAAENIAKYILNNLCN